MADIQYLNYGDLQIELLALLKNLADLVQGYVLKQPWSNKRKEKFMSAYSDIMNKGILGASNSTGQWMIDVGDTIDLDSMGRKDKEMYQEAAYFIQQQMAGMPTKSSQEEEKKKELDKFDFYKSFHLKLLEPYNGKAELFADLELGWDAQDKRGDNGLRSTEKRRAAMQQALRNYLTDLEGKEYNFEGSNFKDKEDAKAKIQAAIDALGTETEEDDLPAFSALGLKYRNYFSNGGNDASGYTNKETGEPLTWNLYNKYQQEQAKLKTQQKAEKIKAAQKAAYDNTLFFNRVTSPKMLGQNSQSLKLKYGTDLQLRLALYQYAQGDIRSLTPDLLSEILGAYRYLAKNPIDNKLLKQLLSSSSGRYAGAALNRFRKINGIDNLIWDNLAGQVIQINNRQQQQAILNQPEDLFKGVKTLLDILNDYMNSTEGGFTPAELREVAALLFDLGAAIDPEGVTSAGLSQVAAGIRDYNRKNDPEGWTLEDTGWAALDHGLGLLSAIPVAGGWVKGAWAAKKLGNYLPKMEKWIRLAGRAGSTYAMAANAPGALNTLNKIKNGEDLSLKDYQDLAYFFIGGLGHHLLNRGNRIERSAMKARGMETSNSILNKAGITRTKAKPTNTSETTPTLKVLKTGEDGKVETQEIHITKEQEAALKKAKPGKLNEVAAEVKIDNIPEGYKIVEPTINSNWRNRINTAKSWFGKGNSEIFGTPTTTTKNSSALKSDEEFEQYLSEHNNTWLKKIFNGSNRDIRKYDKYYLNNPSSLKNSETSEKTSKKPSVTKRETPLTSEEAQQLKENVKSWRQEHKDILNINKNKGRDYEWSKNDVGTNPEKLKSSIKLGDKELNVEIASDGILIINGEKTSINGFGKNGKKEVRKKVRETVQLMTKLGRLKRNTEEFNKLVQELKKLKSSGFLKQGGKITDSQIDNFLKQYK